METSPVTCRTLETFYHIDAHTFEKQYKETLSGFRDWDQLDHADSWLLFPENIGPHLAIDESSLSNGELYTFVTNRDRHTGEGSLVAVVSGTKSEDVIQVLKRIDEEERMKVEEVTLDLSDSMRKIVSVAFPKAQRVIDRFHIQKLACDAVQEIRVAHRCRKSVSHTAGMPCNKPTTKWKSANMPASPMRRSGFPMGTRARNCLSEAVTSCSNQQASGRKDKRKGLKSSSRSILTSKWLMACPTH